MKKKEDEEREAGIVRLPAYEVFINQHYIWGQGVVERFVPNVTPPLWLRSLAFGLFDLPEYVEYRDRLMLKAKTERILFDVS